MLGLILIVVLKVNSGADQVERMGNDTAGRVGREGRQCRHDCLVARSILGVALVEAQSQRESLLEHVVDGVENSREGYVPNQ